MVILRWIRCDERTDINMKSMRKIIAALSAAAVLVSGLIIPDKSLEKVQAEEASPRQWVVTLDPGHGGSDGGASNSGVYEKNCNLAIAKYCKAYIESHSSNITVKMTREGDTNPGSDSSVSLTNRANIAKAYDSDLFVSIHNNSSVNSSADGAEVIIPRYFYNSEMTVFGNDVLNYINASTGIRKRRVYKQDCTNGVIYTLDENGRPNGQLNPKSDIEKYKAYEGPKSGYVLADFYGIINRGVSRQMPTCIIEHAFISNPADRSKLSQDAYLKKLGEADARAIIKYFESGIKENDQVQSATDLPEITTTEMGIAYRAHVQNIGWQKWMYDGETAGTTGKSLRVEAIKLYPYNLPAGATITARAHIQDIGWRSYNITSIGGTIGTSGMGKRLEAMTLTLNGVPGYEIEYRVHAQNVGWTKWMSQGEVAGTSGLSYRLEGVEIRIVPAEKKVSQPYITYRSHVQNEGWLDWVSENSISGTSGKSYRMESININLHNPEPGMYISARVHIQNYGWRTYARVTPQTLIGTSGESLRIESINLMLNGTDKYKLQYRVHIQNLGWTGWLDQGTDAGTSGRSYRLEAIQIRMVEK